MAAIQFNTRIDKNTKVAGDEAFASVGLTPSHVVQATWAYAARNKHNKKKLRQLVGLLNGSDEQSSRTEGQEPSWVEKGPLLYREMLKQMGISGTPQPLAMTDDELLFEAMRDRAQERGTKL